MSDLEQPLHFGSEGFWPDDSPDVPTSEWSARCSAGVLHYPESESVVCLCGLDEKEWPEGLEARDGFEVGDLPRVEWLAPWSTRRRDAAVAAERLAEEVDRLRSDLAAHDTLGVDGLSAVPVAHPVGAPLDPDGAVRVDDPSKVGERERVHIEVPTSGGDVTPFYADEWLTIYGGDNRPILRQLPAESVHCVVTSPPFWGLRDYGTATWEGGDPACDHRKVQDAVHAVATSTLGGGKKTTGHQQEGYGASCARCGATRIDSQLGLERTPEEYVAAMVDVFREVRRVLRADGTVWLNLGDSYATGGGAVGRAPGGGDQGARFIRQGMINTQPNRMPLPGLKPKDLVGIPWRVAFALQADGWYLRSDIVWAKPNPMPESVTDRPTKSHEYLFLLSKSPRYYYDAEAIGEPVAESTVRRLDQPTLDEQRGSSRIPGKTNGPMKAVPPRFGGAKYGDNGSDHHRTKSGNAYVLTDKRNARTVWTVATQPYPGAHFATFPPKLVEPCIKAGCPADGVVLDPFAGTGTVGKVAAALSRRAVLIDLNPDYLAQCLARNAQTPLGLPA